MEQKTKKDAFQTTAVLLDLICGLLILLFVYTALSKLLNFSKFEAQMAIQALPPALIKLLIWTMPPVELFTSALLLFARTRLWGLWIAGLLMALFTGYVGLALLNAFGHIPCACGGVIAGLGWKWHFVLNLFFLLLSFLGIYLNNRERSVLGEQ